MSLRVEFFYTCDKCKKEHKITKSIGVIYLENHNSKVEVPNVGDNWECDGLGGHMCHGCYKDWRVENGHN
jgi:hypothetical protein